jgi:hypothetical protein
VDARPLPQELNDRSFTVGAALSLGVSRDRLRGSDLATPVWGVRSVARPASLFDHCHALATGTRDTFAFSHVTAALLWGLPLSYAVEEDERLHVIRCSGEAAIRRPGVAGHRGLEARQVREIDGLPVVGLADTWVDFGELIGPGRPVGLDDLIILGDAIATRLGSVKPLGDVLEARVRPRGKLTLLEALEWIRVGSESAGETRARLVLIRAGLPEPELNKDIVTEEGFWLGRPDMRYSEAKVALEYQGVEFHAGPENETKDEARFEGFAQDGWDTVPIWNSDVSTVEGRAALVCRVAELLAIPQDHLTPYDCGPRFFSTRMLELAEKRRKRFRGRAA